MPQTPQAPALAYKVETWAIDALRADGRIPEEFQIAHHDEAPRANANRIFCTAKRGEQDRAGCKPWNVDIEIRLTMATRDPAQMEDFLKVIEDVFLIPRAPEVGVFRFFSVEGFDNDERETGKNSRSRAKTLTVMALEL